MNKQKRVQEDAGIKKMTLIGMIALLALLLLFLLVTVLSTTKLKEQVQVMSEHPFVVNGDVGDVRTDLALMRIRTERLQSYNQPEDVALVRTALEELYIDMETLLTEMDELYLGPDEDINALWQIFQEIQDEQGLLLEFAVQPDVTTQAITRYEEAHLSPLYEQFDDSAQQVLAFVRNTQQRIFNSAEMLGKSALGWSIIVCIAMTIALFVFQHTIRKMSRRLYAKNRQFEILSETVDEAFLIFGEDPKRCEFVSGSVERLLGIPAELLQEDRMLLYQYMTDETAAEVHQTVSADLQTTWETTLQYHHPQYVQPRWLQLRAYHLEEVGDIKYILTFIDRTEDRRAAQALQDALVSAQNANNAKKDFLSRMSHEIRTPMNAIIGMATIAAASIDDRRRVEDCLEKIGYSSKHLLLLINDVLDMSRIESNRVKLNHEPFELYQLLNSFVSVIYPQATIKGLEFTEKTTGFTEHTTYLGDSLRLNQILLNLASNAIKFTPKGGKVSLEVSRLKSRGKKSWLRFVVADTGIGMDEEALAKLYTPFEQADASIAQKYGGTGLGMSITQNLVALMGGYIDVKSKPDEGTIFTVELPFEESDIDLQPIQEGVLESLEVLVADDEQDICEHTVLLLEKMKIRAQWVLSGTEAVEKAVAAHEAGNGFDVCFIDWKMPDIDGVETTRRIREKVGRETPIIIISAYDWSDIEEEARQAGVNAFIAKPLFQSSIYNVLVSVTNGAFGLSQSKKEVAGDALDGKRLLLAEDNALNKEIAVTLLEMNGAVVESVENGQEALDRFMQKPPGYFDAILMDVQMPVMDGCQATRHIRACGHADAQNIPIIATTANAFAEDVSQVLAAGMNEHISKPLDMEQLCAVLARLCDNKDEAEGQTSD